jgi:hypothetical protein
MRKHSGMRPQDIPILLKIVSLEESHRFWQMKDISRELKISPSEVSESLNRSVLADLLDEEKRNVNKLSLTEFLIYGIKYVFPLRPGPMVKGFPTAHSALPLSDHISSDVMYVWPDLAGKSMGFSIEPLYPFVVHATQNDIFLYKCLALIDVMRIGRAREQQLARVELEKLIF